MRQFVKKHSCTIKGRKYAFYQKYAVYIWNMHSIFPSKFDCSSTIMGLWKRRRGSKRICELSHCFSLVFAIYSNSFSLSTTKAPTAASPSLLGFSYHLKLHRVLRWQVTGDSWRITFFFIKKMYRCFYLHTVKDLVSPLCRIFKEFFHLHICLEFSSTVLF